MRTNTFENKTQQIQHTILLEAPRSLWNSLFSLKLFVLVASPLFCCSCCFGYELSTFFLCCSEYESEYELDINCIFFSLFLLWIYPPFPIFFPFYLWDPPLVWEMYKRWSGSCFFACSVCNRVYFPSSINPFIFLQSPCSFLFCVLSSSSGTFQGNKWGTG